MTSDLIVCPTCGLIASEFMPLENGSEVVQCRGCESTFDSQPALGGVEADQLALAVLIRETEMAFLGLFANGKIHGTVHTCVGQELSAVAFAAQLKEGDFIFSNHRGHGHYLAFTDDVEGLVAELMGKSSGVCGGIGSSQHLCAPNFFTNGIQGGIVPCAAGFALASRFQGYPQRIGIVFIGDGTLGEGVVYESLNLISLLKIPLLIVCEDNGVAQSTLQEASLAGNILSRADAFGVQTWSGSTDAPGHLTILAADALETIRETGQPGFFHVRVARLNAHSKGDDERPVELVAGLRAKDILNRLELSQPRIYEALRDQARGRVESAISEAEQQVPTSLDEYLQISNADDRPDLVWGPIVFPAEDVRMVVRLQDIWSKLMGEMPNILMIGEDIQSPYGGAFKVTRGLSDQFPLRVISTPISEAAITGLANGLALAGLRPVVEIMFGDFITLALDQLVNHAAKFHHMYNRNTICPMVLRTPMGGGRGYGPTHSQSLEKLAAGVDTITTVALNCFVDPERIIRSVMQTPSPVVIIENKLDYGRRIGPPDLPGFIAEISEGSYPVLRIRPNVVKPQLTMITYGGMAQEVVSAVRELFDVHELLAEVLIYTQIGPIDPRAAIESARRTGVLVTVEEGTASCGIGGEFISCVSEVVRPLRSLRIASLPVPIPSPRDLESQVLPSKRLIVERVAALFSHG